MPPSVRVGGGQEPRFQEQSAARASVLRWVRSTCAGYELDVVALYRRSGDRSWPLVARSSFDLERQLEERGHFLPLPREPAALANILEVSVASFILRQAAELAGAVATRGPSEDTPISSSRALRSGTPSTRWTSRSPGGRREASVPKAGSLSTPATPTAGGPSFAGRECCDRSATTPAISTWSSSTPWTGRASPRRAISTSALLLPPPRVAGGSCLPFAAPTPAGAAVAERPVEARRPWLALPLARPGGKDRHRVHASQDRDLRGWLVLARPSQQVGARPVLWLLDAKIRRNMERDARQNEALANAGWQVVRVWDFEVEHDPSSVARRIVEAVRARRPRSSSPRS